MHANRITNNKNPIFTESHKWELSTNLQQQVYISLKHKSPDKSRKFKQKNSPARRPKTWGSIYFCTYEQLEQGINPITANAINFTVLVV